MGGVCALAASVLKCWMLEGTEGELREEDRAVGWVVVELEVWQIFGGLRASVGELGWSLGLSKLGASGRAPNALAGLLSRVGF